MVRMIHPAPEVTRSRLRIPDGFLPDFLESLAGDHAQETSESARKQEGSLAAILLVFW